MQTVASIKVVFLLYPASSQAQHHYFIPVAAQTVNMPPDLSAISVSQPSLFFGWVCNHMFRSYQPSEVAASVPFFILPWNRSLISDSFGLTVLSLFLLLCSFP